MQQVTGVRPLVAVGIGPEVQDAGAVLARAGEGPGRPWNVRGAASRRSGGTQALPTQPLDLANHVAEVVRNLSRRERGKGLSSAEKRMLAKAREILISEVTFVVGSTEVNAEAMLDDVLGESR